MGSGDICLILMSIYLMLMTGLMTEICLSVDISYKLMDSSMRLGLSEGSPFLSML